MHRTLKEEIFPDECKNLLAQQEQLDRFREGFNERRPHEALKMKYRWRLCTERYGKLRMADG